MSTCLALDSTLLRWHDESRQGGIAPDGCAGLKSVGCEVQHGPFCRALGSASVSWRVEIRRQRSLKSMFCGTRHEHLPCLGQCGGPLAYRVAAVDIALDGCSALKLMCCEVQHEHWPCLGRCSGQLACGDPLLA